MKKHSWVVHGIANCETCGWTYENYKNAQGVAANHAKRNGHLVRVDVGLVSEYDGTKEAVKG
jgi:hypothetical protein